MPELPEVETIVRYLRPRLKEKRVLGLEVKAAKVLRGAGSVSEVRKKIINQKILDLERLGKNIILSLENNRPRSKLRGIPEGIRVLQSDDNVGVISSASSRCERDSAPGWHSSPRQAAGYSARDNKNYLLFHLMLTGQLLWNPAGERKHDRLVLQISGNNKLVFNDVRKFGRCRLVSPEKLLLGQDALAVKFTEFKSLLAGKKRVVKSLLMDQQILAGIGNIYADEILWYAGIKPIRTASTLSISELERLHASVKKVLRLAVKKGGTSSRDYLKPDGSKGEYYEVRKAYQREGEKCARDGAIIKRIKIGGRSSHFCPKHQK